jgi:hypothetical protein
MPIKQTSTRINPNQGILAASNAATQASAGPAINADRVPNRSSTAPLTGKPTNRPTAKAVTVCAAVPAEMPKDCASTGTAGMIIAHMPASKVLV